MTNKDLYGLLELTEKVKFVLAQLEGLTQEDVVKVLNAAYALVTTEGPH